MPDIHSGYFLAKLHMISLIIMKTLSKTFLRAEAAGEHNTFLLIDVSLCRSIVNGEALRSALNRELVRIGYEAREAHHNSDALAFMVEQGFIETPLTELHMGAILTR